MPSNVSQSDSQPPNPSATGDLPPSPRQRTVAREVKRKRGKKSKSVADRRASLMRKHGVTAEQIADAPQIMPLLKQNGIKPDRLVEVLRCDSEPESLGFVQFWDALSRTDRSDLGLEAVALAAGLTPRRLWELYHGAALVQAKESVAVMMAEALPVITKRMIARAKTAKGDRDRDRFLKATRVLPVPKGSTTVINMPNALTEGEEPEASTTAGDLESADDFLMRAGKAMHGRTPQLPAAPDDVMDVEVEEE